MSHSETNKRPSPKWRLLFFVALPFAVALLVAAVLFAVFFSSELLMGFAGLGSWGMKDEIRETKQLEVGGVRIVDRVVRSYGASGSWSAFHRDSWDSCIVVCELNVGTTREKCLMWEVGRDASPHPRVPPTPVYVVPLSHDAAQTTPELMPRGCELSDFPPNGAITAWALVDLGEQRSRLRR